MSKLVMTVTSRTSSSAIWCKIVSRSKFFFFREPYQVPILSIFQLYAKYTNNTVSFKVIPTVGVN